MIDKGFTETRNVRISSEAVNYNHYSPVSLETIGAKLRGLEDRKIISQLVA